MQSINFPVVFFSYAIVTEDKVSLFINPNQINEAGHKYLDGVVDIHPYEAFLPHLTELANSLQLDKDNVCALTSPLFPTS
jgi:Xaa-Pro aminopeptidase